MKSDQFSNSKYHDVDNLETYFRINNEIAFVNGS